MESRPLHLFFSPKWSSGLCFVPSQHRHSWALCDWYIAIAQRIATALGKKSRCVCIPHAHTAHITPWFRGHRRHTFTESEASELEDFCWTKKRTAGCIVARDCMWPSFHRGKSVETFCGVSPPILVSNYTLCTFLVLHVRYLEHFTHAQRTPVFITCDT